VKEWDEDKLIRWIQRKSPNLLKCERLKKFKAAEISGKLFLSLAGNMEFFEKKCHLPVGSSQELADLASEIAGGETSKLLSFIYISSSPSSAPMLFCLPFLLRRFVISIFALIFHINGFLLF
jgi:hypothetical protein